MSSNLATAFNGIAAKMTLQEDDDESELISANEQSHRSAHLSSHNSRISKKLNNNSRNVSNRNVPKQTTCRALICDSNGIIIAEMVHRCVICSKISDTITDAQSHYKKTHMGSDGSLSNMNDTAVASGDDQVESDPMDLASSSPDRFTQESKRPPTPSYMNSNEFIDEDDESSFSSFSGMNSSVSNNTVTYDVPGSLKQLQQQLTPVNGKNRSSSSTATSNANNASRNSLLAKARARGAGGVFIKAGTAPLAHSASAASNLLSRSKSKYMANIRSRFMLALNTFS